MILGGMLAAAMCAATGCSVATRLERQRAVAHLSQLTRAERQAQLQDYRPQVVRLQRDSNTFFLAPVDTLPDGERVMSLQIEQVTVVAKVRSVPERNGRVHLDFVVTLPKQLLGSSRSVVITPLLHKPDGTVPLEDLVIRGGRFSLLQERDYWQYETYVRRFRPDTLGREAAFQRFVKFPYPEDARLDSLVESRSTITYYYSQEVPTDETSKKMLITLTGKVQAVDDSAYRLPPSDTLAYLVSSMLSFVDTLPRYRIRTDPALTNREAMLELLSAERDPDRRERLLRERFPREYAYLKEVIYPQLRAVDFRYNLRRKGMVKDTIHTTELDTTYARGVELLQRRQYARALYILRDYNDRNTVVAHLSMDHNERALELLSTMPTDAVTEYLRAIACSRLGRKAEGREHFIEACRLDERMEYRGNLDPEISELLKD